jgi:hypothetical protein
MGDAAQIIGLALLSMFNPTLLAAVTVMLLLPNPKRLMLGYLLGALLTSITVGLLVVFAVHDSAAVSTAKKTLSPAEDIVFGLVLLAVAVALRGGHRAGATAEPTADETPAKKKEPLPMRLLGRGSPRVTFAVGILLSFPGASYLLGLAHIDRLEAGVPVTAAIVVAFCLVQQLLLELPLLGYAIAPERTATTVSAFRGWLARNGRRAGGALAGVLGLALIARGLLFLLT